MTFLLIVNIMAKFIYFTAVNIDITEKPILKYLFIKIWTPKIYVTLNNFTLFFIFFFLFTFIMI